MLPKIELFTQLMQNHIDAKEHEYDTSWTTLSIDDLVDHFKEEVNELRGLIERYCPECHSFNFPESDYDFSEIQYEAIDVANMAYMIWYIAMNLIEKGD